MKGLVLLVLGVLFVFSSHVHSRDFGRVEHFQIKFRALDEVFFHSDKFPMSDSYDRLHIKLSYIKENRSHFGISFDTKLKIVSSMEVGAYWYDPMRRAEAVGENMPRFMIVGEFPQYQEPDDDSSGEHLREPDEDK